MNSEGYQSSIRLRRMPSEQNLRTNARPNSSGTISIDFADNEHQNRRRSTSAPTRPPLSPGDTARQPSYLPTLVEASPTSPTAGNGALNLDATAGITAAGPSTVGQNLRVPVQDQIPIIRKPVPISAGAAEGNRRRATSTVSNEEYGNNLVDLLDLVDPEVSTLQTLTNVQNSLFVPSMGRFLNRRPTYNLTRRGEDTTDDGKSSAEMLNRREPDTNASLARASTNMSITSRQTESHFAVLPHGTYLEGWSEADKQELDDHVRHFLHSKRSRFKRSMKGFGQYVRKPLGFFVTLYATLITLFGLAWVLFLIGWINVGGRQLYIINIIDNVLVALFAVMGDGLAPFRAVDTYHMIFIAHYHHYTWSVRKKKNLPELSNQNDLPHRQTTPGPDVDIELGETSDDKDDKAEQSVLTPEQQKKLDHHQKKFSRSHTFYKPHETATHHAFPLRLLVAVVVLLDCHSCLQLALGLCTWTIDYRHRPFALTTVILCVSITVNITAGVLISIGDHRTRKKDVLEKMHRQDLTREAIEKLEKRRDKERERNEALDETVDIPPPLRHSEDLTRKQFRERLASDERRLKEEEIVA